MDTATKARRTNRNLSENQKWGVYEGEVLHSKHASEKLARGRWTFLRNDLFPAYRAAFEATWSYKLIP
jgi:hypothetical protein